MQDLISCFDYFLCAKISGLRYIRPICVDVRNAEPRSDKDCYDDGLTPPSPKVYRCNTDPCPTRYVSLVKVGFLFLQPW